MSQESAEFDDRLRRVAPPPGMAARLRAIPDWSDRDLDAQLVSVEVPPELVGRLHAIVDDCRLDEHLRKVTVPPSALVQSRRIAGRQQQAWVRRRAAQWAVAASLMLLVWSGFVGGAAAFLAISLPEPALHK